MTNIPDYRKFNDDWLDLLEKALNYEADDRELLLADEQFNEENDGGIYE